MPKILAVITARGGSKGLVRKNILDLAGMPLIAWTIQAAKQSKYINRVVLSSDDDEIMTVAEKYGCEVPFRRPAMLASDDASSLDVLFHAIGEVSGYDYVILLQPTSPLRTSTDIDDAFDLYAFLKSKKIVNGVPAILAYKVGNVGYAPDDVVIGADTSQVKMFFQRIGGGK